GGFGCWGNSGKKFRRSDGNRFKRPAVFSSELTRAGFQPTGRKNSAPSGGANLYGAPAAAIIAPPRSVIIFTSAGDAMSVIHVRIGGTAPRSRASDSTCASSR